MQTVVERRLVGAGSPEKLIIVTNRAASGEDHVLVAALPAEAIHRLMGTALAISEVRASADVSFLVREVTTCLEQPAQGPETPSSRRMALLDRAKAHIEENLEDPELSPQVVAAGIFVSTRYLHLLFKEEGKSVTRYIMSRRLAVSRTRLRDPRLSHQSIGEIADRLGFKDASHFARAFKNEFGQTPSRFRAQGLQLVAERHHAA